MVSDNCKLVDCSILTPKYNNFYLMKLRVNQIVYIEERGKVKKRERGRDIGGSNIQNDVQTRSL